MISAFCNDFPWNRLPGAAMAAFLAGGPAPARPSVADAPPPAAATVIAVVGAAGETRFGENFQQWSDQWKAAAERAGAKWLAIGLEPAGDTSDRDRLRNALTEESQVKTNDLWLVLIGHGTFDGAAAKFNLRGPDFTAGELNEWLQPMDRPVAVINASSSSGPYLKTLAAPGRVIVTATKSGHELNYARFGRYLAEAVGAPQADLDKDGQASLLEAFLLASRQVAEFYEMEGRLATEHALLEDNGDGLGTPADWFRGIRAVKKAAQGAASDGLRAHQFHLLRNPQEQIMPDAVRSERDALERDIARLRDEKPNLEESEYYERLEALAIQLAKLYDAYEADPVAPSGAPPQPSPSPPPQPPSSQPEEIRTDPQ